jgi:hypothetical protein
VAPVCLRPAPSLPALTAGPSRLSAGLPGGWVGSFFLSLSLSFLPLGAVPVWSALPGVSRGRPRFAVGASCRPGLPPFLAGSVRARPRAGRALGWVGGWVLSGVFGPFRSPSPSLPSRRGGPGGQVGVRRRKADARDPGWHRWVTGRSCELGCCWSACRLAPDVGRTSAHVRPRGHVQRQDLAW